MKEIETRIVDIDVESIRKKLINNCEKVKEEDQINYIYDFPDRKLLNNKGYARIRIINNRLNNKTYKYMTVKKLISQDKYKIMDEYETEIDNSETGMKILEALGLTLIQSIKKYRESYKYKNTLIEIDINEKSFCPFPYIEIETQNESELIEVLSFLGYTMNDTTSKTIYEILNEKGAVKGL